MLSDSEKVMKFVHLMAAVLGDYVYLLLGTAVTTLLLLPGMVMIGARNRGRRLKTGFLRKRGMQGIMVGASNIGKAMDSTMALGSFKGQPTDPLCRTHRL